jgi:hypothetical protein
MSNDIMIEWMDPYSADGKSAVTCRMSVADVIHFQLSRTDVHYTDAEQALQDFIAVHWAHVVPDVPEFMVRGFQRAIHDATHPTGMGVHDGKCRVESNHLHRLLLALGIKPE